jgi:hypothetical protein
MGENILVGDHVIVWPRPGRGLEYRATVERITGDRVTVRPIDRALSQPGWCNSTRARSVKITTIHKADQ